MARQLPEEHKKKPLNGPILITCHGYW